MAFGVRGARGTTHSGTLKPWYKRKRAAVAQMDRARASEARGREFESPQPHHSLLNRNWVLED
jgi:hypothetical protein